LSNASPRRTELEGWRRWRWSASDVKTSTLFLRSTHGPSGRRNAWRLPPSSRTLSATVASVCRRRGVADAGWFPAHHVCPMTAFGLPTLHRHHRAHRAPMLPARTPRMTPSFSLLLVKFCRIM
jgi:hypothetical protein